VNYNFNFGDGSYIETSSATADHIYNSLGTFNMSLEVEDEEGNTAITSFVLNVVNDNISPAVLSTVPTSGTVDVDPTTPIEVVFTEDIDALTLDIELAGVDYDHTYDNTNYKLQLDVNGSLAWGTQYIITLSAADLVGNWLNGYQFNFTVITFENYDSDGDGVPNIDDAFPDNPMGALDTDNDSKPDSLFSATGWTGTILVEDLDDDNDNWTDVLELNYSTDPKDALDFPADLDGDHIPDTVDPDIDGDGVPNGKDEDPYDPGVGEEDEDDYLWAIIAVVVIVIIIVVIIIFFLFLRPKFFKRDQDQPMAGPPMGQPGADPGPGLPPPDQPPLAEPVVGPPPPPPPPDQLPGDVPPGERPVAVAQPVGGPPRIGLPPVQPQAVPRLEPHRPEAEPQVRDGSFIEDEDDDLETF
jgi:hypothetical protein